MQVVLIVQMACSCVAVSASWLTHASSLLSQSCWYCIILLLLEESLMQALAIDAGFLSWTLVVDDSNSPSVTIHSVSGQRSMFHNCTL